MKSPLIGIMRSLIIYQKTILISLIMLLSELGCIGQVQSSDNNAMMGVFGNPAYTSNNDSTIRLHLFSFESWAGGSKASIYLKDITNINNNFFREKVLGTKTIATGWGGFNIIGPSFVITPNKTFSFGVTTRSRVFANYWNVDGRLVSEIEEDDKVQQTYPYDLANSNKMSVNTAAWSDIGLSFSLKLIDKANYSLRGGASLHYLSGLAHCSISANINGGTIKDFGGNLPYLTNSSGSVSTFTSGDLFNSPSVEKLFKLTDASLGLDVGFVYEYLPYKIKIGTSITDIGKINYTPDQQYSKLYDMNIPSSGYLFLTQNFPNTPFNHLTIPLDSNGLYFKQKQINSDKYSISLPTAFHLTADVQLKTAFYLNVALNMGLQPKNTVNAMYTYRSLFFTPRYETKKYTLQLPLSYQSYTGFNVGLSGRFGPVYIGSGSFFSGLLTKSRQLDAYAGIEIPLQKKKIASVANGDMSMFTEQHPLYNEQPQKNGAFKPLSASHKNNISGFIEAQSVNTTNGIIPFWMRSNNYGSNPIAGFSTSFIARISKGYDSSISSNKINWSTAFEMRANAGISAQAILVEAYAQVKLNIFQLKIGRSKDILGIVDPDLSSGSFAVSGNTLGIPKIELSIPDYWGKGLVSIKASIAHGWMGETRLREYTNSPYLVNAINSYYHQFSFYGKIGKPSWKFKFLGGINHEVMWGHENQIYGADFKLDIFNEYLHVITGTNEGRGYSKIGNSIGSIDQGFEMDLGKYYMMGYHQFFYDIGALGHLANINDGLWGLSLRNKNKTKEGFSWKKILLEVLISKNQAGEPGSRPTTSGAEDYYNNYLYKQGWSYVNQNIGNPLFTNINYSRNDLPRRGDDFIINSRIIAVHLGNESTINKYNIITKVTYSKNYGTWNTAPAQRVAGPRVENNPPPYFPIVNQFSGYLEANKQLKNGYKIGGVFALDVGSLLYNSTGLILKISKSL